MKNILAFCLMVLSCTFVQAKTYNVTSFGAKGDGRNIDSEAINKAIEQASADGGGTVYIPAGNYACYSIQLKSHITLYFESGAKLIAEFPTADAGYDKAEENSFSQYQDFGHSHWKNSLIWGIGLEDITICGPGQIYGKGLSREESRLAGAGNKAISLKLCKNVIIKDLTMIRCGHFAVLATGVDNLSLLNIKVDTNRDGFDIDCCNNVRITDCTVNSPWDDAIVLKASYALGYFKPVQNVTITGCYVSGFDQGSVINATWQTDEPQAPDHAGNCGRIKLGTESSGDYKNIAISNCIFEHCRGLAIESVDGGHVEDVTVDNITMRDIVNSPIFLRLGARQRSPKGTPLGTMKRIRISNITVYNADSQYSNIISGVPGNKIEDVTLSNINIYHKGGYSQADSNRVIPEQEKVYPDPLMFGTIPASGFYVRHAKGIIFDRVNFHFEQPDGRPLYMTDDAEIVRYDK